MSEDTYEAGLAALRQPLDLEETCQRAGISSESIQKFLDHVLSFGRPKSVILGRQIVHDAQAGTGTSVLHRLALKEIEKEGLQGYDGPLFVILDELDGIPDRKEAMAASLRQAYARPRIDPIRDGWPFSFGDDSWIVRTEKRQGDPVREEQECVVPLHTMLPAEEENNF